MKKSSKIDHGAGASIDDSLVVSASSAEVCRNSGKDGRGSRREKSGIGGSMRRSVKKSRQQVDVLSYIRGGEVVFCSRIFLIFLSYFEWRH